MSPKPDSNSEEFFDVAVAHGLLLPEQVDAVRVYADEHSVHPSDAALTLSAMKPWKVEAALLLTSPTSLASGFRITGLIGAGAAGTVFRAHQESLGRDVALKTINMMARGDGSTGESRIQREAQAIARLQHPHIVAAYDSGFHRGRFCIAMELVEGETLADLIDREAPLSEPFVWSIVRQASAALDHARQAGIIHRDIKPANLLLCEAPAGTILPKGVPFVKVADFGLAFNEAHDVDNKLTATGATLGSPAYVAPEQLQNTRVDSRSDIYSLGTTVFHMITGKVPWANRSPMRAILDKTVGDDSWRLDFPESASPATAALFRDMTATEVNDRIPDYSTLIDRIDRYFNGEETPDQTVGAITSTPPPIARNWQTSRVSLVVITGIVLSFMAFVPWNPRDTSPPETIDSNEPTHAAIAWAPAGLSHPLFNGRSVPFGHVTSAGTWKAQTATDGSAVLMGAEGASLVIPLKSPTSQSFNVSLQLKVHVPDDQTVAELRLEAVPETGEAIDILHTVTISNDTARLFKGGDTVSAPTVTRQLTSSNPDDVLFRRVQVQRTGNELTLLLNGRKLVLESCHTSRLYSLRVRCERGLINLGDISITELARTELPKNRLNN